MRTLLQVYKKLKTLLVKPNIQMKYKKNLLFLYKTDKHKRDHEIFNVK